MMKTKRSMTIAIWLVLSVAVVLGYQNCQNPIRQVGIESHNSGNGDSYSLKPSPAPYLHFEDKQPCSRLDANGAPYPREEIIVDTNATSLTRKDCVDIVPVPLAQTDYTFDAPTGNIIYQSKTFNFVPNFDLLKPYNQVPLQCPSGKTLSPTAVQTNILKNPFNFLGGSWVVWNGINVTLDSGTIDTIPWFKIMRTRDAKEHVRIGQRPAVKKSTNYVATFLVKPGNTGKAVVHFYQSSTAQFGLGFDFNTMKTVLSYPSTEIPSSAISGTIQPYGSGYLISVFFKSAAYTSSEIGIASFTSPGATGLTGDYIWATAAYLQETDLICN